MTENRINIKEIVVSIVPFKAKIRVRFPLALPAEFENFSVLHGWQLASCNCGPSSAASSPMAYFMTLFFEGPL